MAEERIPVDRVPTPRELEQMFADQVAQDYLRARKSYGPQAGAPGALALIDVMRPETLPPRAAPAAAPTRTGSVPPGASATPRAFCAECGKMFEHARKATAKAMATKCAKTHAEP